MTTLKADPNSLSNPLDVRVLSSHISLHVDFKNKILDGHVDHNAEVVKEGSESFVLDTRSLNILKVSLADNSPLEYKLGEASPVFGIPLNITIPSSLRTAGSKFTARVHYTTTKESTPLQWLEPSQTAGGVHPYLFSQCQAIHARGLVPCQDTPSNKITYTANITVHSPLTVLMSATSTGFSTTKDITSFSFDQPVPIPTYLIAIVAGELESREIGPRSKVWSEPKMVEAGAYEFANTEDFIRTGEELLTPYVWGRYDILLLPPSFPYGGMENPQLTFVTPTLLAGDRSLENVVAHEIAHSWMGNLVTNRYWSEFFLNEGFTVFIERKILARRAKDNQVFDFEALGGVKHLQDDIDHFGATNPLTALRPNLEGTDPDDAFSSVPYEKGFNLLCYLQSLVGVEKFEQWLKTYVSKFQYQSITADQMKDFYIESFPDVPAVKSIDWDTWFDKPGMPAVQVEFSKNLANVAIQLAKKWVEQGGAGTGPEDLKDFSTGQILAFLDQLLVLTEGKPLSLDTVSAINKTYSFDKSRNSEVRFRWYTICLRSGRTETHNEVAKFLTEQGRMKFVRPLYRELNKLGGDAAQLAKDTFTKHREFYHSIASKLVAKDLGLDH